MVAAPFLIFQDYLNEGTSFPNSRRERGILALLAARLTTPEVAEKLMLAIVGPRNWTTS